LNGELPESRGFVLSLLILLTVCFVSIYGATDLIGAHLPHRLSPAQGWWPFWPRTAPLYLSLNVLLLVSFWRLRGVRLRLLFTSLTLQTVVAGPLFLLFPLEHLALPYSPTGTAFRVADILNLDNNYLPSLHAAYAFTCAYFLRHPVVIFWSTGIICSTFLTYQHYPVDTLAGVMLAWTLSWWLQRRESATAVALTELVRCSLRHRRYSVISLGLLGYLLTSPRRGRVALIGFTYLQRMDDLLDGHLESREEPLQMAHRELDSWSTGSFGAGPLGAMGEALYQSLPERRKVPLLIEEMMLDRRRVKEQLRLQEEDLLAHLERTFQLSLDLMLTAAGAKLRSNNTPSLAPLLGWCSMVRDLEEDLELGLINVPADVADEDWFREQYEHAKALYERCEEELLRVKGESGARLLGLFHKSVKKYLKSYRPETSKVCR